MRITCALLLVTGCGTYFNKAPTMLIPPQGGFVDGAPGPQMVDQRHPHEVVYPDGRRCIVESGIDPLYLIPDIFLTLLIGVVVDASNGYWRTLDASNCPGVVLGS